MQTIFDAMKKYSADGALAFHTPGHKQGLGAHELLKNLITVEGLRQEVSLMEELDDLHSPHGCIAAAEKLAVELDKVKFNDAAFPIAANVNGALESDAATIKNNLIEQTAHPVK